MLYRALTGRPPHQAASPPALFHKVLTEHVVAPRDVNPEVPVDLDTIVVRCLAKEPARRYARAADVVAQDQRAVRNDSHEHGGGEGIVVVGFAFELGVGGVRRERRARTAQQHEKAGADQSDEEGATHFTLVPGSTSSMKVASPRTSLSPAARTMP